MQHKEWAAQKVVTTFEADAKSSDHLFTRSHEGGTRSGSTTGDITPLTLVPSLLFARRQLPYRPLFVFSYTPASEQSITSLEYQYYVEDKHLQHLCLTVWMMETPCIQLATTFGYVLR